MRTAATCTRTSTREQARGVSRARRRAGEMRARNDEEKNLPEPTRKANVSLREAANHFSLALRRDNRFLFMGDLEGASLGTVVADLASRRATRYLAIVSPHHGTKWHDMNQLRVLGSLHRWGRVSYPRLFPGSSQSGADTTSRISVATWRFLFRVDGGRTFRGTAFRPSGRSKTALHTCQV